MKSILSERVAVYGMLTMLSLVVVFHLCVITGFIPFGIVWGGRLKDHNQVLQFEAVSIFINLVMLAIVAVKAGLLKVAVNPVFIRIMLWIMAGIFALNTVGNLFSTNRWETIIFTPITLLLSVFCIRLAISGNNLFNKATG